MKQNWYNDVIKRKHFQLYWLFLWGIHQSPVNFLHKGHWRGALMSLICAWISSWVNNRKTGDLRHHRAHYRDDVIKWKHFQRYWPFVWGIQRSPVISPHKGQWHGALMIFSLICAWIKYWVNNREAGDFRRHHIHYNITVMMKSHINEHIKIPSCLRVNDAFLPLYIVKSLLDHDINTWGLNKNKTTNILQKL